MKLIIDTFGADLGPDPIIQGAVYTAKRFPEVTFILVGDEKAISKASQGVSNIEIINTGEYIDVKEPPTSIFTRDKTSMAISLDTLKKNGDIIGMLSAGNSGALFVGSICRLGLIEGLKTPALVAAIPTVSDDRFCICDCGANINCTADDLVNFAFLGRGYISALTGKNDPSVGILSVGKEDSKGNALTLEAFKMLKNQPLNFIGNVEGGDLLSEKVDVVVTDGFSGNLILKDIEATGKAAAEVIRRSGGKDPEAERLANALYHHFDLNSRGGATFLGTKKAILKMHGAANRDTVYSCTEQLLKLCRGGFAEKAESELRKKIKA